MDIFKGLFSDTRPQDQPEGFPSFAKNGITSNMKGAMENEPGFLLSSAAIPYKPIGVIQSDKFPIIFSTNNINSAIGYFDEKHDTYIPIYNDITLPFKFGWSIDHYITGEAQRNYRGEVVVAITDKFTNPLYINCDNPIATTLESLYFFPRALAPTISVAQDQGGALLPGAYYVMPRYVKNDGTETNFLTISDVTFVKGVPGVLTDRSLVITLDNLDLTYNEVQLAVISKVGGVTKVVLLTAVPVSSSQVVLVYSGAEVTEDITLEEVLINPAVYNRVGAFGQLNDALFAANLTKEHEINMQKHTNNVKLRWVSDLISVVPPTVEHTSGKKRHFMHQEVYLFYMQYSLVYGGWSRYFVTAGTLPAAPDLAAATETGEELLAVGGVPKYKVEDTIHSFDLAGKSGEMGVWINENERYPDTIDYDSTSIGGENLRGQSVRHHRFPSVVWCKENLYAGDPEYGKTKLDLMGVRVSGVQIPSELASIVTGWRLVYAKRTIVNSTVIGQSLLLHAARAANSAVDSDFISTGGNWGAVMDFKDTSNDKTLIIDKKSFRFHAFDMLFTQPAVSPSYIAPLLKFSRPNLAYGGGLIEDFAIEPDSKNGPIVYLVDYIQSGTTPEVAPHGKRIRKIKESNYVPVNVISGIWKNLQQETVYAGILDDTRELLTNAELSFSNLWVGPGYELTDKAAQFEYTYLTNLMALKNDIGKPFTSQSLTSAGQRITGATGDFFGGDCFISDYAFHTYGWNDSLNRGYGAEFGGIKTVHRFICESVANINLRYETPGNIYSKWYPDSPLIPQDPNNYILLFNRKIDPNQFGYSRDLSSVNEFIFGVVFDPSKEDISEFPFRIHRGGKLSRQDKRRSWRTFLPLDYYEAQKNMGFIVHLEGYRDRLIIHHENAMFMTQGKTVLENGLLGITLGSGDVFQLEPQEQLPAKLGYAGTQHDLACIKTPLGYVFLDARQGQVFLYNGELKLQNGGINNFLRDYLRMIETNPFIGNGYTIGYDPDYKRLILTSKSRKVIGNAAPVRYDYQETSAYFATLTIGDIIYKNGRFQKFLGVNTTGYVCGVVSPPTAGSQEFTIPEDTLPGTLIGTFTGTNISDYFIRGFQHTFYVIGNKLYLGEHVDYEVKNTYPLSMTILGPGGGGIFNVIVHITDVINEPPSANNGFTIIDENSAMGFVVWSVIAVDPAGNTLTYSIVNGNSAGKFSINSSTGVITVSGTLDHEATPEYALKVNVSNGTKVVSCIITIEIQDLPEAPLGPLIHDLQITNLVVPHSVIGHIAPRDPEGGVIVISTIGESRPGLFTVGATTGDVTVNAAPPVGSYTMDLRATDNSELYTDFVVTIDVVYDDESFWFVPVNPSCSGTTLHWDNIEVRDASGQIALYPNTGVEQYFQGIGIPFFGGIATSVACGGTHRYYLNDQVFAYATKNDCPEGAGTTVKYIIQAGLFITPTSLGVSDEDAQIASNADAQAAADSFAQTFANTRGDCIR